MNEEEENSADQSFGEVLSRYWWLGGIAALVGWFALLWFMFGDVL